MSKGYPRGNARRSGREPAGPAVVKQTILLKNKVCNVAAAGTGVGFGTVVIGDFPKGNIQVHGCLLNLVVSSASANVTATWNGNVSIGTTPDADGTLSGTEVNLIASAALGAATAKVSPVQRLIQPAGLNDTVFDNTDNSLELNFNMFVGAADFTDATNADMLLNGSYTILYAVLSDD